MIRKVYKLFHCRKDGTLESHFLSGLPKQVIVQYKKGELSYPKLEGSYLYASLNTMKTPPNNVLYECEADVVPIKARICCMYMKKHMAKLREFWNNTEKGELCGKYGYYGEIVFCKWIKPIRIVYYPELEGG
jgi:hypothetical protein